MASTGGRPFKLSPEVRAKIAALFVEGKTLAEVKAIADKKGWDVSKPTLLRCCPPGYNGSGDAALRAALAKEVATVAQDSRPYTEPPPAATVLTDEAQRQAATSNDPEASFALLRDRCLSAAARQLEIEPGLALRLLKEARDCNKEVDRYRKEKRKASEASGGKAYQRIEFHVPVAAKAV